MPITAKFVADFDDFDKGVKDAEKNLISFETAAERAGGRLMDLQGYTDPTASGFGSMTGQLRAFDSALSAAGIKITPAVRALEELQRASSATDQSLGLLGKSAAAVAVGFATFNVTSWILGLTGLDKVIGDLGAKLNSAALNQETAAAKADVLARASQNAGREVTNFAEAVRINAEAAAKLQLNMGQAVNPVRETAHAISNWQREIREVRREGNIEALNADLQLQAFSLQDLSTKYGITVDALEYYKRKNAEVTASELANRKAIEAQRIKDDADLRKFYNDMGVLEIEAATRAQAARTQEAANIREFYNWVGERRMEDEAKALEAAKRKEEAAARAGAEAMEAAIKEEQARWAAQGLNTELAATPAAAEPAASSLLNVGYAAQQATSFLAGMSAELHTAIRSAQLVDEISGRGQTGIIIGGPGLPVQSPSLAWGRASTARAVNITINGSVLGNKDEIARVVGDSVMGSYRSGGSRVPV
jgi:hypothetical protein